ncbi:hypothetical protein NFK84_14705 [Enterobacter ludwigii]|uniref:hypothetical protein n=1 Tax=Enterobacter ludwigii TaxID=299767 RepID=UPI00242C397B|nr:hypothetical protein [Enterobacter ludwigii]WGA02976.1 hypothetical protein NFK84_14705 [Enterobacter ludwigii]
MSEWIGVDFDGVLATYEAMQGKQLGNPVPAMVQRVQAWRKEGKDVRVFTARAGDDVQKKAVTDWLNENGLSGLEVTNMKAFGMVELWDDRAVRVRKNTGKPCSGCRSAGFSAETDC